MIRKTIIVVLSLGSVGCFAGALMGEIGGWHELKFGQQEFAGPVRISNGKSSNRWAWIATIGWGNGSIQFALITTVENDTPIRKTERNNMLLRFKSRVYDDLAANVRLRGRYLSVSSGMNYAVGVLLAGFPILALIRGPLRRHRRRKRGLCATCGYDLRGSPEMCPECGEVLK